MTDQSVCIYHNGNSRIVQHYRAKFSNLKFSGNWSESVDRPTHGHLWEICFADATRENMIAAVNSGIHILRHISDYNDDLENLLPECARYSYIDWTNNVVSNNLCFANQVVSDIKLDNPVNNEIAIITTGRTANSHFQLGLKQHGLQAFEYSKQLDQSLLEAKSAVLLWRNNQWDCLTSTWIAMQTDYNYSHQLSNAPVVEIDVEVSSIDSKWIDTNWVNLCQLVLDHAMFYRYVCQRPITHTSTEYVVTCFQTRQQRLNYNKEQLIANYTEIKNQYDQSDVAKMLKLLYNNVTQHILPWSKEN